MADKKLEKALYGPSMTEVALGAVLGLIAGLLAACVYLVFKPVSQVKELPKEPVRGTVYYLTGSDSSAKSRAWSAKQKQLVAGQGVDLVEDELNAWAVSTFGAAPVVPPAPKPGAKAPMPAEADKNKPALDGIFNPGSPNFRIVDGSLQVGVKCVLNWYGLTHEVQVIATGDFKRSGDNFVFTPRTFYLGSCPLHLLPAVSSRLAEHLMGKKKVPDEIKSAWAKLGNVTIEGHTLKLAVQ